MRNPYEVLGVREGADLETIKRAYRELVKKYHPDQYMNNPLSDLAAEKLKEINEAYDDLVKKAEAGDRSRGNGYSGAYRGGNPGGAENGGNRSYYDQARSYINIGNIGAAESILESISYRDGEWHYLRGLVFMRKGWYGEALESFRTAVNMEPGNLEFREALNRVMNANRQYNSTVYERRGYNSGPDLCTLCQCLWCSDCCCECMGGDLISCC